MKLIAHRYYFALDMDAAIERVTGTCHISSSLESFTHAIESQTCSYSDPPVWVLSLQQMLYAVEGNIYFFFERLLPPTHGQL